MPSTTSPSAISSHLAVRPDWFWDKKRFGGILTDIGSHQFDQYLHFTGSTQAFLTPGISINSFLKSLTVNGLLLKI